MSSAPRGERLIIAIIGKRNAGKSSLINAIVGQEIAIVSDIAGTTTDPVDKHYELLPLGPVTFYDTAGVDDSGELGLKRVQATQKILYRADIAIFVSDGKPFTKAELDIIAKIMRMELPILVVFNKSDQNPASPENIAFCKQNALPYLSVSSVTKEGINECKDKIIQLAPEILKVNRIIAGDLVKPGENVILVTPIDSSAPKGRLILPQVETLRDLLDRNCSVTVLQPSELKSALDNGNEPPALVITDSQAIEFVAKTVPKEIPLTTFSILFARYKGELDILWEGVNRLKTLKDGDKILIAEACSHHIQKDDIGRVKIPYWMKNFSHKDLIFEVYAGHDFPENLEEYAVCVHCGGCMITSMEMNRRIMECHRRGVPITNYGMTISLLQGVLERTMQPLLKDKNDKYQNPDWANSGSGVTNENVSEAACKSEINNSLSSSPIKDNKE
ncbi:MAG: [FeFe] hydrogenase H-cluster maturation GTPase HydF [Candidatus Cloacimonas sp.]